MKTFEIPSKLVGKIIGPGGATINAIIDSTGVSNINIDKGDPAMVTITSTSDEAILAATEQINAVVAESGESGRLGPRSPSPPPPPPIQVGDLMTGCEIKSMVPFGVFVQLRPGVDGFCHISELSEKYIKSIDDVLLKAGDLVDVKVSEINKNGQYRIKITSDFEIKASAGKDKGSR